MVESPLPAGMRYAGFWVRFLADLIDSLLLTVASWLVEGLLLSLAVTFALMVGWMEGAWVDAFKSLDGFWIQILNIALYCAMSFFYYVWGHFRFGTTLGKKPFGIRVVTAGGFQPLTLKVSIHRYLGYVLSALPAGAGYTMAAFHPEKKALHDLVAGTVSIIHE